MASISPSQMRRLNIILSGFAVLTLVIIARIIYLATAHAERREQLRMQSRLDEELIIPGCRGKLCTADGQLIAWTRRMFSIEWQVPPTYDQAEIDWYHLASQNILKDSLPPLDELDIHLGQTVPLKLHFDYNDVDAWDAVMSFYPSLIPHIFFKREQNHLLGLSSQEIGTTQINAKNGIEIGISGLEQSYDEQLRASFLRCRYLSKRQRFIMDNLEVNGHDVILTSIEDGGGH